MSSIYCKSFFCYVLSSGTRYAGLGKDGVAQAVVAVGAKACRHARDVAINIIWEVVHDIAGQECCNNF